MKSFDIDVVIPFWIGDIHYVAEAVVATLNSVDVYPLVHIVCDNIGPQTKKKLIELPDGENVRKYYSTSKLGPSVAVNSIAKHYCATPYLAIQDADDIPFGDRFSKQYQALKTGDFEHSSTAMIQFPSDNYHGNRHIEQPIIKCLDGKYRNMPYGKFINSTRMITLDLFKRVNGFPNMMVSGDLVLDNVLILLGIKSICFDQPLAYRRVHNTSITHMPYYLRENEGGKAAINKQTEYLRMMQVNPTFDTADWIGDLRNAPELEKL